MINPYDTLVTKEAIAQALKAAAASDEDQLRVAAQALGAPALEKLRSVAFRKVSSAHTQSVLYTGGLLHLYRVATEAHGNKHGLKELVQDLEITKTKAYDSIATFRGFGGPLLANTKLIPLLPVESLKRLSARHVPSEVREHALRIAEAGERVTIKRALQLLKDHGCEAPLTAKGRRAAVEPYWSYTGSTVRLTLIADDPDHVARISVLHDLEAAIATYRAKEFGEQSSPDAA